MPKPRQYYDPHPGLAMVRNWIDALKEKTGRNLDEWTAFIQSKGPKDNKARREWLKNEHGFGTNSAWRLADHAGGGGELHDSDPDVYRQQALAYVETMFSGSKASLRPLYDRLYEMVRSISKDVRVCPGKTIVAIYRNHVIAQIKPSTRTRIDLGLALKETPATGRLADTGGLAKKDRITLRIEITSPDDIDAYVEKWLRRAYEMD